MFRKESNIPLWPAFGQTVLFSWFLVSNLQQQSYVEVRESMICFSKYFWLVVSNIFYFPFHVILPIDELVFFKMVIAPPTRQSRDSQSRSLMLKSLGEARCTAQLPHKSSEHSPSPIVVTLLEKPVFAHCPPLASPCCPKIFLYFLNHNG